MVRGRKPKYDTEEERMMAKREQTIASNKKNKEGGDLLKEIREVKELLKQHIHNQGGGVMSSISNLGKKAYKGVKDTASKVVHTTTDVAKKVITGNTGLPPNVKKILDKEGEQIISKIVIARNPVGSALISALSVASMGQFKKNLEASPYDKLFHLKLILTLQNGKRVALEKVERVSMTLNPKAEKGQEDMDVPLDKTITLNQLYHNAEIRMGDKFYPYSARDNNCQNFVLNVLQGSNIGDAKEYEFIKQNTTSLFGDETFLRKLSNTVTDVGARFNVLMQGGSIKGRKKGGLVFPPNYVPPDFSSLPPYLQNDAMAGDITVGGKPVGSDDNSDTSSEEGGDIDFEDIEWGSFKKYFQNRPKKLRHLKTMKELAQFIHKHPDEFNAKTRKRAEFYLNVLIHKK